VADRLENLLDLGNETCACQQRNESGQYCNVLTNVEDRHCELNMTEMARALIHIFAASAASQRPIDRTEFRIVQSLLPRPVSLFVHRLRILDSAHAHALDFLGWEKTELDFLNSLQRRAGIRELVDVRHVDGEALSFRIFFCAQPLLSRPRASQYPLPCRVHTGHTVPSLHPHTRVLRPLRLRRVLLDDWRFLRYCLSRYRRSCDAQAATVRQDCQLVKSAPNRAKKL